MPDWSRRRALHAVGAVTAVALAGCSERSDPPDPPSRRHGDPVTDYDLLAVRESEPASLFWRGERDGEDDRAGSGPEYVASATDLEDVSFASDSEAAAELSAFASATDFDERSVLLQARPIAECYEPEFRGVWRDDDGLATSFCRRLRPADEACGRDAEDTFGFGLRVPFSDGEFTSFGSEWSGGCHPEPVGMDGGDGALTGAASDD
jgi:hypothetical protein